MGRERKKKKNAAAIARSMGINKSRLEKIEKRTQKIQEVAESVKTKAEADMAKNEDFIVSLIVQAALMLLEDSLFVHCRTQDKSFVQGLLGKAQQKYKEVVLAQAGVEKETALKLHEDPLSDDSLGGVVGSVENGNITVENTIAARLA